MQPSTFVANNFTCKHPRAIVITTGGWHFGPEGPWDDIREQEYCPDCRRYVSRKPAPRPVEAETETEPPF